MEDNRLAYQYLAGLSEVRKEEAQLPARLGILCSLRDQALAEMTQILTLKKYIETIRENQDKNVELQVNIGENTYVQAEVSDCSRIYVHFGLGVWVDLEASEALEFIEARHIALKERVEHYKGRLDKLNEDFVSVLEDVHELESRLPPGFVVTPEIEKAVGGEPRAHFVE